MSLKLFGSQVKKEIMFIICQSSTNKIRFSLKSMTKFFLTTNQKGKDMYVRKVKIASLSEILQKLQQYSE